MDEDWDKALKQYKNAISKLNDVDCKGKAMPYTSVNGHMFSFIDKDGIIHVRLDKEGLKKFIKKHDSKGTEQYGHKMKEYAMVPTKLYSKATDLSKILKQSQNYAMSLKPKTSQQA